MSPAKEVSLYKWCSRLPENHRVNQELLHIAKTLSLLSSMVRGGELFSDESRTMYYKSQDILEGKKED